jgi:hypothetical protein
MVNYLYKQPVDQLLCLGDARDRREWPDYLGLGLDFQHVPDLIRMATDPALNDAPFDSPDVWAPAHAWRAWLLLYTLPSAMAVWQPSRRANTRRRAADLA